MPGPYVVRCPRGCRPARRKSMSSSSAAGLSAPPRHSNWPKRGLQGRAVRKGRHRAGAVEPQLGLGAHFPARSARSAADGGGVAHLEQASIKGLGRATGYTRAGIMFTCADDQDLCTSMSAGSAISRVISSTEPDAQRHRVQGHVCRVRTWTLKGALYTHRRRSCRATERPLRRSLKLRATGVLLS